MPVVEIWCVQYQVLVPAASWAGHHSWAHLVASQLLLTHYLPHFEWGILSFLDAGFWMQAIVSCFIVSSEYMLYFRVFSHTKHGHISQLTTCHTIGWNESRQFENSPHPSGEVCWSIYHNWYNCHFICCCVSLMHITDVISLCLETDKEERPRNWTTSTCLRFSSGVV